MRLLSFHAFLLSDSDRVDRYARAIEAVVRPGDVVVDLGAGVGILSFLAVRAGAERVYAIESSDAIHIMRDAGIANGFADRVHLLHGRSTDVELPERARVLITDTFEIFGLNQGLLGSVKDAAERFLEPGGAVIPGRIALHAAPVEAPHAHHAEVGRWGEPVHGLEFGGAASALAANNLYPSRLGPEALLAEPARLADVELGAATPLDAAGSTDFTIERDGTLHGFVGWFAAELIPGTEVTNAPGSGSSGYLHALLPLLQPVAVAAGDRVELRLFTYDGQSWRWRGAIRRASGDRVAFDHSTLNGQPGPLIPT